MSLPRIMHVDSGRSWRGGQRQVLLLAAGLHDRGYRTLVVAPAGSPLVQRAERAGLPTYRLTLRGEWDVRRARELRAVAREWRADIIHAHDARSHTIGLIAQFFKRKSRLVVTRRVVFPPRRVRLKYKWGVDAFIAISNAVRNAMVDAGVSSDQIKVVYSGVPAPVITQPRNWRIERGWSADTVVCGIVGAMTREKGLDSIGAIAKRLPPEVVARIRIVLLGGKGKGDTTAAGLDGFDAGFVSDIHEAVAGLDLLLHPAKSEGLGTAVIDAMALGVTPIAFAVGGLPEVIEDGVSGRLVSPGDLDAFGAAVTELATDAGLRTRLAAGARKRAGQFDSSAMIERTAEVYKEITAR